MHAKAATKRTRALAALALPAAVGAVLALASPALATGPGSLDTSFAGSGYTTVAVGTLAAAAAVVVQPNGDIVTAGEAAIAGQNVILSTRMTPYGALDPTFGVGGIVTVAINGSAGVDSGAGLALQPDGKIVLAGDGISGSTGSLQFAAVRLDRDGSLDPSFGEGGIAQVPIGAASIATAVVIQPDGKIAIAGTAIVGIKQLAAARLNPDGTVDTSFGDNGATAFGPAGGAWGMVVQPDGKLVLAGERLDATGHSDAMMAGRLEADGSVDAGFGRDGTVSVQFGAGAVGFAVALRPDDRIVLAGAAPTSNGAVAVTALLAGDGSLDQTYGTGGVATVPDPHGVNGIVIDQQGRMVFPTVGAGALRLNADGTPDSSFGNAGLTLVPLGTAGGANGVAIDPNSGNIVLAGAATIDGLTVLTVIRLTGGGPVLQPSTRHPSPPPNGDTPDPPTGSSSPGGGTAPATVAAMIIYPPASHPNPVSVVGKVPRAQLELPLRHPARCGRHRHTRLKRRGAPHRHRAPRCRSR
jgi:uncharacterized delta-60 repeat protein